MTSLKLKEGHLLFERLVVKNKEIVKERKRNTKKTAKIERIFTLSHSINFEFFCLINAFHFKNAAFKLCAVFFTTNLSNNKWPSFNFNDVIN